MTRKGPARLRATALCRRLHRLRRDRRGASLIEFALVLPLMITLGMFGTELAYMASVNMQVSQVALSLADNASRLGQTDNSAVTPTVSEDDIDSVMDGAVRQGAEFDLLANGRIILSSLERDEETGLQYIHWQRCRGGLDRASRYGDDGDDNGLTGDPIAGVGAAGAGVTAAAGSAVMVAEVHYRYKGLFASLFPDGIDFYQEAAFTIRDDRNLEPGATGGGSNSEC